MDETLFYVFGIALVLSALGLSRWPSQRELPPNGSRSRRWSRISRPRGRTATFAVLNARDAQQKRTPAGEPHRHSRRERTTTTGSTSGTTTTGSDPSR